jgi:peptidoglycan hydrolase-like protein with peptidoglycan-binding domain
VSRRAVVAGTGGLLLVAVGGALAVSRGDGAGAADSPTVTMPRETTTVERRDLVQTEEVDGRLGYGDSFSIAGNGGVVTALPAVGQVFERGQQLWETDGAGGPILLYGSRPMYRDLADGVDDGPDVRQLEENLVALGFADPAILTVDEDFTDATADAVERWQEALGIDETGKVARSQVVFMLGPVRVAERKVQPGAEANGEVLTVTGPTQQVHIDLGTDLAELVSVGDAVDVELPDGSIASGTVTSVGTVVETAQDEMGGSTSSLPVTVQLAGDAGGLDEAPVEVSLERSRAEGALAVPVRALLALAEGGYAVERVQAGGTTKLVAVELGEFADGFVEVTGMLAEGDDVVLA